MEFKIKEQSNGARQELTHLDTHVQEAGSECIAQSAADVSRRAKKRGLRRVPVVVIVTLVMALGAGSAIGGPTLYDKFIVPALYDAVPLEVDAAVPASSAPAYKGTVGITDLATLEELPDVDAAELEKRDDGFCESLVNVVAPGHEKGVALDGVTMEAGESNPLTTWGAGEQSYSGVYLYVGLGADSEVLSGAPKDIEVYADGQLVGCATLNEPKEATYQRVEFSRPVDAQLLSIRVLSVYPGELDLELGDDAGSSFDLAQVTPY